MALTQGLHRVLNPAGQLGMHLKIQATHGAQQAHMVGDHVEGLAPLDPPEAHHHRMQGIEAAADGLLQTTHHPRRNPDGIGALVGPGAVATFPEHLHLQLARRGREAAAAHPHRAHRQARKHVHPEQRFHAIHGAIGQHPGRALGRFLGRLKQQPHPRRELIGQGRQQPRHPQAHGGVDVVAAGVHQALVARGKGHPRALLHRQGIHIHPQGHQRGQPAGTIALGPQLRQHPGAAHPLLHTPAQAPQLPGHQRGRLVLVAAELGVSVQVTPQGNQLRQGSLQRRPQRGLKLRELAGRTGCHGGCWGHRLARARKSSRACTGWGGQRRICNSHSDCR